jgi:hypothetical protein
VHRVQVLKSEFTPPDPADPAHLSHKPIIDLRSEEVSGRWKRKYEGVCARIAMMYTFPISAI